MSQKQCRWLLGGTALALCAMLAAAVWRTPAPPVEVAAVQAGCEDVYNSVMVKGIVRARQEERLTTARPAQVQAVYVGLGDRVQAGTPLVRVQDTLDGLPEQAAALLSAPDAQRGAVLYAGMDGTAVQLPAVGDVLLPGMTAARVADLSRLRVEARVPELHAGALAAGQAANITPVAAPGQTLAATVEQVAPYAVQTFQLTGGSASATVLCTLALDAPQRGLLPGSTVDVKLFTDRVRDAVTVPYSAVRQDETAEYVLVVDDSGTVVRREIETGYQLSRGVQVTRGLAAGEWVISDSAARPQAGEQVVVRHAQP